MSALRVSNVTMAFGGITAVSDLTLDVPEKQIFSVIGPNGAGKTTVFNVVTGIYAPTRGTVAFGDRDGVKPLSAKVLLGCLAVGLFVAALAGLLATDPEQLWAATFRRPFAAPDAQFDFREANAAAWRHMLGKPGFAKAAFKDEWNLTAIDGRELGTTKTQADAADAARLLLDGPPKLVETYKTVFGPRPEKAGVDPTPERVKDGWVISDPSGAHALETFDKEENAKKAFDKFPRPAEQQARQRQRLLFGTAGGFLVGTLGAFVIWSRGRRTPDGIAMSGVARTFQNIRLFQNMTVLENVLIGMDRTLSRNVLGMALRFPGLRREEVGAEKQAIDLLHFVGLHGVSGNLAKNLPYGDQRRLEIARAMATGPKLLLLDEPAAGMNPSETAGLMDLIRRIRDRGMTVLLIEHHMSLVMGISDRIAVLDYGVKIAEGTPAEIASNPKVIEAYLGKEEVN